MKKDDELSPEELSDLLMQISKLNEQASETEIILDGEEEELFDEDDDLSDWDFDDDDLSDEDIPDLLEYALSLKARLEALKESLGDMEDDTSDENDDDDSSD